MPNEKSSRVMRSMLGGYLIGAYLGWTQTNEGFRDGQRAPERAYQRSRILKVTGIVVGFAAGLKDIDNEKRRRCAPTPAGGMPLRR